MFYKIIQLIGLLTIISISSTLSKKIDNVVARINDEEDYNVLIHSTSNERKLRELQFLDTVCNATNAIIPGFECSCSLKFGGGKGPTVEYECSFTDDLLCVGPFCSTPSSYGNINFNIGSQIKYKGIFEFCFKNIILGDTINISDICINVDGDGDIFSFASNAEDSTTEKVSSNSFVDNCYVEVGGSLCNTCEPCNKGRGLKFNCGNIDENIIQSTCRDLEFIGNNNNINDNDPDVRMNSILQFFPVLDGGVNNKPPK